MNKVISIYLDFLRFSAAITVALYHLSLYFFSSNAGDYTPIGVSAVAVFFVISGYVIAYVVDTRDADIESYLIARAARIYSVLIPSIIFSTLVWKIATAVNMPFYSYWERYSGYPLIRIFAPLIFMNQAYGYDISNFSNTPVWSLGYEVPYYLLFGFSYFFSGSKRAVLMLSVLACVGANVLTLLPAWLFGVFVYRSLRRGRRMQLILFCSLTALGASLMLIPDLAKSISLILTNANIVEGKSREFFLFWTVGSATSISILVINWFAKPLEYILEKGERTIRLLASSTFTIYLFHFPIFVLIYSLYDVDRSSYVARALVFFICMVSCFAISRFTECKKDLVRQWIEILWHRVRSQAISPSAAKG